MHHDHWCINAVCLSSVTPVKDLGLLIDSQQLKLDLHINAIVAKAHARTCLIFRWFISKDLVSLNKACITYVRPLVKYTSCVCSPVRPPVEYASYVHLSVRLSSMPVVYGHLSVRLSSTPVMYTCPSACRVRQLCMVT